MDPQYLTSADPLCPVKGGVLFWLVELTQEQIDSLRELKANVRAVVANIPYNVPEAISSSPAQAGVHSAQKSSNPSKRDATAEVLKQVYPATCLAFLSTPLGKKNSQSYAYLSPAGLGTQIFVIASGLNTHNNEFYPDRIDWLYAIEVDPRQSDDSPQPVVSGTCVASLMIGKLMGVAKEARLTMVKAGLSVPSLIDAVARVIDKLQNNPLGVQGSKGYTVLSISGKFDNIPEANEYVSQLQKLFNELVYKYQTIVVTSAGTNDREAYADINSWPSLLAAEVDIITVGSVAAVRGHSKDGLHKGLSNGQRYPWSVGGDLLTVNGPGNALCAGKNINTPVELAEGGSISHAIVTGLVAYFLSLEDLGGWFRRQNRTPKAMIRYLKMMSYRRYVRELSVWNGLDSEDEATSVDGWYGTPIPDPTVPEWNWPPADI